MSPISGVDATTAVWHQAAGKQCGYDADQMLGLTVTAWDGRHYRNSLCSISSIGTAAALT